MPVRAAALRRGGGHRREFAVRLQFSTWPEVGSCLERSTGILIPLGSTEQHGPSGLIGTDALVAEGIAARAASEDTAMSCSPPRRAISPPTTGDLRRRRSDERVGWELRPP